MHFFSCSAAVFVKALVQHHVGESCMMCGGYYEAGLCIGLDVQSAALDKPCVGIGKLPTAGCPVCMLVMRLDVSVVSRIDRFVVACVARCSTVCTSPPQCGLSHVASLFVSPALPEFPYCVHHIASSTTWSACNTTHPPCCQE